MNKSVGFILNFLLIFGFGFSIPASIVSASGNLMASISQNELTTLTNNERLNRGLPVLKQNNLLQKAAELKANDMKKYGYFSHVSPDGKLPWDWVEQAGYKFETTGENLMADIFVSSEATRAWMESPSHRENILNREYTHVGTAVAQGMLEGKETVFAVQVFGSPKGVSAPTQITIEPTPTASAILPPAQLKNKIEIETTATTKIASKPKTITDTPKKVVREIQKKDVAKDSGVLAQETIKETTLAQEVALAQETPETNQYPRLYYTYDNGRECVVV
jgi:hypothetical protein